MMSFACRVSLDEIQSLDGDIQPRAFRIGQQHELTGITAAALETGGDVACWPASRRDLKQSLKLPDAVIYVDNVIADLQITEIREKGGSGPLLARFFRNRALRGRAFDAPKYIAFGKPRQLSRGKRESVCEFSNSNDSIAS